MPVSRRAFRPDVEGLRAVAVGLVLLYHAGLAFIPGGFVGVDVFFVISGFLITGLLVDELERTGRISLVNFYARRAKRLLPAAALVLGVTVALTLAFVPRIRWSEIGGDIVASALYVVNWRLAERSVDYLAEDSQASPVMHYWSLAVEEQYYLVWPILLLLAAWWARRSRRRVEPRLGFALWVGLALVGLPSLAWSIYLTRYEPASAFFVTTTRMWELAIGAAVALAIVPLARLPRVLAIGLGWVGLTLIAISGVVFSSSSDWPGYAALIPTLGTAAVIAAGPAAGAGGPVALLGTAPLRWVGGLSYSLYLWHWPLLSVAAVYLGGLSTQGGLLIAACSIAPAWLTHRLIENPIRHSVSLHRMPRLALSYGANFSLVGVVGGLALVQAMQMGVQQPTPSAMLADELAPGASVLSEHPAGDPNGAPTRDVAWIVPDPLEATKDVPVAYDDGCQQDQANSDPKSCLYGDENGRITVALVGDSKALQWLPALDEIARHRGWRLVTYTKSACPFAAAEVALNGEPYESCAEWNQNVLENLVVERPDLVLTSQGRRAALQNGAVVDEDSGMEEMARGLRERWSVLMDTGIEVAVIRDTPQTGMDVYACVSEHRDDLTACTYSRIEGDRMSAGDAQLAAALGLAGVGVVDLNDAICPTDDCAPVIGNVLVYRQGSHLTATYVKTLRPRLERALLPVLASAGSTGS